MMNLYAVRKRCDELLLKVLEGADEAYAERLWELRERLAEMRYLPGAELYKVWTALIRELEFSAAERMELRAYIERPDPVSGVLYAVGADGQEHRVEAPLEPVNECYYQFLPGPICKERLVGEFSDFYSLINGRWVYDPELERMFTDTGYNYQGLNYTLLNGR